VTGGRKVRILLACQDRAQCATINRLVANELPAEIREAANGPDAFDQALAWIPDLFVLAAELHGFDGLQLCHRLRGVAAFQDTPVIVLGPRGDQKRKYQAFYVGATDYVEVPFDGVEFVYRLRAPIRGLLRQPEAPPVTAGGLTLEPATRTARVDGREAVLTPSEYAVLRVLAANAGTPLTVERLLGEALGRRGGLGNPQLIHTHVKNLRKKLERDPGNPDLLVRHPAGYMLNG
jgi:DNA-binding response OmpR family regulator